MNYLINNLGNTTSKRLSDKGSSLVGELLTEERRGEISVVESSIRQQNKIISNQISKLERILTENKLKEEKSVCQTI